MSIYSTWSIATNTGAAGSYAGGGGGGADATGTAGGAGGAGGGGSGQLRPTIDAVAGTAKSGGGGGGFSAVGAGPGAGGAGVVIIRTNGTFTAASTTGSPTRVVSGGYTYYTWTGNGSITI